MDIVPHNTEKKTYGDIYEYEADKIRERFGDIEIIRKRLGLSGSKLCQMLKVDPSAWTRWTKHQDRIPPHIWQALEWKLQLLDFEQNSSKLIPTLSSKNSELTRTESTLIAQTLSNPNLTLQTNAQSPIILSSEKSDVLELHDRIQTLERAVKLSKVTAIMLGLGSLILAFVVFRLIKS